MEKERKRVKKSEKMEKRKKDGKRVKKRKKRKKRFKPEKTKTRSTLHIFCKLGPASVPGSDFPRKKNAVDSSHFL